MNDFLSSIRNRLKTAIRSNRGNTHSPRFDTSDVLQDALIQVASELDGDQPSQVSQRWLRRIAIGHLAKHLRYHNAEKRSVARERGEFKAIELFPRSVDPFENASKNELAEKAVGALTNLDDLPRRILMMRFFEDASYDEIADALDVSVHVVRSNLVSSLKYVQSEICPVTSYAKQHLE